MGTQGQSWGYFQELFLTISPHLPHFILTAVTRFGLVFHFSFDFYCTSSNCFFLHVWQMKSHSYLKRKPLQLVSYWEAQTPCPSCAELMWPHDSNRFMAGSVLGVPIAHTYTRSLNHSYSICHVWYLNEC